MTCTNWKEYKLEELTINHNSKRVPLSSRERENRRGIYPYYGAQGVIDYIDDFIFDGEYLLVAEDGNNLKERKEDIARIAKGKFWVNNHAHILTNNELSDLKFLKYYLNHIDISGYVTGSAQPKLNKKNLNSIKIIAPDVNEQKRISNFLYLIDYKIEVNDEINKTLEEISQTIFKHWFIDFEFPNENGEPYKSSGGKFVESELGMIPEGWKVNKIGNVTKIVRGASPRPINDYISSNGMPWIKISDATNSYSKYILKTEEYIKIEGINKSREVKPGTLILSNSATPGIPKEVLITACVHDGWLIFDDYCGITKEYLYYFLLKERNNILALSNGSVFRNLKTDILKNYKIIIPEESILEKATTFFKSINQFIKNNVLETESLEKIRNTLLPKLMSGEIRIPEAEEAVESCLQKNS